MPARKRRLGMSTPTEIADVMQEWFEGAACDGFNVTPATLPGGGEDFVDMVVPELQRRGLFRTEYEGRTLRENLGLRPVINRYSRQRPAAEGHLCLAPVMLSRNPTSRRVTRKHQQRGHHGRHPGAWNIALPTAERSR